MAFRAGLGDRLEQKQTRPDHPGWSWRVPFLKPARRFDPLRVRHTLASCPEIDCLRGILPPGVIAEAELRAAELGVGADDVLVADGRIDRRAYARALALSLHVPFNDLTKVPREAVPLSDTELMQAALTGHLPVREGKTHLLAVAPSGLSARHLLSALTRFPGLHSRLAITSTGDLRDFVAHHGVYAIGNRAANALKHHSPGFSAGTMTQHLSLGILLTMVGFAAITAAAPGPVIVIVDLMLAAIFLGWTGLRLAGMLTPRLHQRALTETSDRELPVYSVIVALYREAAAVQGLVAALRALDYPKEKLDIKFAIESDDAETRAALEAQGSGDFEIVIVPAAGPRTKPKALNAALLTVRGRYLAVFDAEDRPQRSQLRNALAAFAASDHRLACVQARLCIDNTRDNWLAALFTAEYAGLFDVFLPGLAAWRLPLPLGGSSNHFRVAALRRAGAWDPYNVTEDADLGMRLSRLGYRTDMIGSTTYEEAPARVGAWLRQRTRWFKGWMQTWIVHMRDPVVLLRQLNAPGFAVFQLVVGGTVLAALVHPVFLAALVINFTTGFFATSQPEINVLLASLHGTTLVTGYLISAALGIVGLARRGLLRSAWVLILTPLYWLMLSAAAWRALYQLMRAPYRWEKTEHGLARTSRLDTNAQR